MPVRIDIAATSRAQYVLTRGLPSIRLLGLDAPRQQCLPIL